MAGWGGAAGAVESVGSARLDPDIDFAPRLHPDADFAADPVFQRGPLECAGDHSVMESLVDMIGKVGQPGKRQHLATDPAKHCRHSQGTSRWR